MALIAHSAADLVDQLILLTRRLADIAERQAALFEASRWAEAAPLNDEAGRLAATYALEETERFRHAMAAHERTIERQRILAEGLVRAIAEEAVAARPTPIAYGPGAQPRRDTSAVALDRRA
jgi:hypothetical protein